jgi:hypothetical protein
MLAGSAKATGTERKFQPDRGIQVCRKCRKSDDASERFSSRCKSSLLLQPRMPERPLKVHKRLHVSFFLNNTTMYHYNVDNYLLDGR